MGGRGEQAPRKRSASLDGAEGKHKTVYSKRGEYKFEYDIAKSKKNKEKHGIDFEEARELWDDNQKVKIKSTYENEPRELVIAKRGEDVLVAVTTNRGENVRIISVRRARDYEVDSYGK